MYLDKRYLMIHAARIPLNTYCLSSALSFIKLSYLKKVRMKHHASGHITKTNRFRVKT